jgi:hypothetical protein
LDQIAHKVGVWTPFPFSDESGCVLVKFALSGSYLFESTQNSIRICVETRKNYVCPSPKLIVIIVVDAQKLADHRYRVGPTKLGDKVAPMLLHQRF